MARTAGIWCNNLEISILQNTLYRPPCQASRYFDFPSMKTAENVDGKFENKLPSMKNGKNVDEKYKTRLPSMKRAVFVDGKMIL